MPWEVRAREDEWCVYKVGEDKPVGCHASRARAVDQQRALYAQESTTASGNGVAVRSIEIPPPRIDFLVEKDERMDAIPALVAAVEAIAHRIQKTEEVLGAVAEQIAKAAEVYEQDRAEFVRSLTAAMQVKPEAPVVNVSVPEQASPVVRVDVPQQPAPVVNVTLPESKPKTKNVTIRRDYQGVMEGVEIEEL